MIYFLLTFLISSLEAQTPEGATLAHQPTESSSIDLREACIADFKLIDPKMLESDIKDFCEKMKTQQDCRSEQGRPIYYYDKVVPDEKRKILAMSLIHGDEKPSSTVTQSWINRLGKIDPRNTWRVIPVVNPDGLRLKTRTNAKGVDLNRNFPTKSWEETALEGWKTKTKSDPRRYPGPQPASEKETQCLLKHFEEFKPDFIISIHTPYGVLDFDGPRVAAPKNSPLPWSPLGNFPGSLGRFMWKDNNIPVLTIELKGNVGLKRLEEMDRLQDISGKIAIEAKAGPLELNESQHE